MSPITVNGILVGFGYLPYRHLQGESLARGPKLLSIKNYVFEIMT